MNVKIGEKIKELRKRDGVTQEKLAAVLGVTNQAVSKWECGDGYPDINYIKPIANFFNVTIDELFDNNNDIAENIEVQLGVDLCVLLNEDEKQFRNLKDGIQNMRQKLAQEAGAAIDRIVINDNLMIKPDSYLIKIKGKEVASGEVILDRYLTIGLAGAFTDIEGIETTEPAYGHPAKWILPSSVESVQRLGYVVVNPLYVIITHLQEVIKKHITP